ncbi:hypothetical protein PISL3812_04302 [Talaromyces islandicus]|uniref:Uncharacterized protein n=1 Tax=Talaromyces islandicus TaxID=28573 RepID=A0A0U1LVP8_TALIS|nr:hypothetical protein PISL3812_04302 [Talaromyces islandicus]
MATMQDLQFYFMITPIEISDQRMQPDFDQLQHWYPPIRIDHFRPDAANSTGWHRWTQRGITQFNEPIEPPGTKSCSIFFDYTRSYFLIAQEDCLTSEFSEIVTFTEPWVRLSFEHTRHEDGRLMSLLTFHPAGSEVSLHAQGGPTWMPELLPYTYDGVDRSQHADVAGQLSVLLGLAAFTCEPERHALLRTMEHNFQPPRWIPHNLDQPAICKRADVSRQRGYVVKVAPCSEVDLQAYEDGHYGPLLVGDEDRLVV